MTFFGDLVILLFVASTCQSFIAPMPNGSCPIGHYLSKKVCEKCKPGYYSSEANALGDCFECTTCDTGAHEVENTSCTPTQNRVCVCKPGFYKSDEFCKPCQLCQNCADCSDYKRYNQHPTSTVATTTPLVCGTGFFLNGGRCQSCVDFNCKNESCKSFCTEVDKKGLPTDLMLVFFVFVGLLGSVFFLLFIWFCRRTWLCWQIKTCSVVKPPHNHIHPDQTIAINIPILKEGNASACNETTINTLPVTGFPQCIFRRDLQSIVTPLIANGNVMQKESWPAPVLYTIIREIPVMRWKEFLRLLSMSDDEMERIEFEAGPSYLEKQYMMLRLWSQNNGAKLENIISTLHYMNLSGRAEELEEKLELLQASMKPASS